MGGHTAPPGVWEPFRGPGPEGCQGAGRKGPEGVPAYYPELGSTSKPPNCGALGSRRVGGHGGIGAAHRTDPCATRVLPGRSDLQYGGDGTLLPLHLKSGVRGSAPATASTRHQCGQRAAAHPESAGAGPSAPGAAARRTSRLESRQEARSVASRAVSAAESRTTPQTGATAAEAQAGGPAVDETDGASEPASA